MRQDVKDLADAMERGWKLAPKNCYWFFNDDAAPSLPIESVTAACAMGHALLGIGTTELDKLTSTFPILDYQRVGYKDLIYHRNPQPTRPLEDTINYMMGGGWTTPQIIAWLRSHQED